MYFDDERGAKSISMPKAGEPNAACRQNNLGRPSQSLSTAQIYPRHVTRALAYLRDHSGDKITVADLAATLDTSERTLRRNFLRFVGLSPLAYLQRLRLTAVRTALLQGEEAISQIATRHGLTHFGRFASAYQKCFGETPSATSRRARQERLGLTTAYRSAGASEPTLVIAASSVDHCGRDMNAFADMLGEQLAVSLSRMPFVTVRLVPWATLDRMTAKYILTARAMVEAGIIRIVTRLVRAEDSRHLWGETFDGSADNMLALQSKAVTCALEAIRSAIMSAEIRNARSKPAEALLDRELVLKALPLALSVNVET